MKFSSNVRFRVPRLHDCVSSRAGTPDECTSFLKKFSILEGNLNFPIIGKNPAPIDLKTLELAVFCKDLTVQSLLLNKRSNSFD